MIFFSQYKDGRNNNFNLIRFCAALLVIYIHSYGLLGRIPEKNTEPFAYLIYLLGNVGVDIFFLVSGFLVTRSFKQRKNIVTFLWARILRIYPALFFALLLTVFGIGVLETNLSIRQYILHQDIYKYFVLNLSLVKTELNLPGVFEENYIKNQVNGSLWTLPVEIRLYIYIAILGFCGILSKQQFFHVAIISLYSLSYYFPNNIPLISDNSLYYYPSLLFSLGALFYINKSIIPANGYVCLLLLLLLFYVLYFHIEYKAYIYTLSISYCVFWFAYNVPILNFFNRLGDYSYGMYIYAFPIQQMIITHYRTIETNQLFIISVMVSFIPAFMSWHLIEKKVLRYKLKR